MVAQANLILKGGDQLRKIMDEALIIKIGDMQRKVMDQNLILEQAVKELN